MMIFVIMTKQYHEHCDPIVAYQDSEKAQATLEAIQAHHAKEPEYPRTDIDNPAYKAWGEKREKWIADHPAGEFWGAAEFEIKTIELY